MIEEEGITSFKTFMAYKGALMIDDGQMKLIVVDSHFNTNGRLSLWAFFVLDGHDGV